MEPTNLHEVAIAAVVRNDGKFLITRRSLKKKRFAGKWTIPGGKLETTDYTQLPKDTESYWYNVLERALRREVQEEVGLEIDHIEYLTSLAAIHEGKTPSLVVTCVADYAGGEVTLQEDEADDFAWVDAKEARDYDLIDGIHDELDMANDHFAGAKGEWQRA